MQAKKVIMLTPSYLRDFKCICGDCEDNCCMSDWLISVDKMSYDKYMKISDPDIYHLVQKYIIKIDNAKGTEDYAKIDLSQKKECPFLSNEKYCRLQLKFGEGYLCNVCSTYPRYTRLINDVIEESASASCPEIARKLLLCKDGIEFDYTEHPINERRWVVKSIINANDPSNDKYPIKYLWPIREISITIIQERSLDIASRLTILGTLIKKIDTVVANDDINKIPGIISLYENMLGDGSFTNLLSDISESNIIQMELLKELADLRFRYPFSSEAYLECFAEFLTGIHYSNDDKNITLEDIAYNYKEAYKSYYKPFMNEREYIFENYIVNHIFKNLFPFGTARKPFDEYVLLVISYALMKMILIGMSGYHKQLTEAMVVKLVQSFSKTVEHNYFFLDDVFNVIVKNNMKSMAYMSILLNN